MSHFGALTWTLKWTLKKNWVAERSETHADSNAANTWARPTLRADSGQAGSVRRAAP